MEKITIKLNIEQAEQISQVINNLFIVDFFEFSNALDSLCDFKELLKLKNLAIDLKSIIDIELDKQY